jgi:chaperone required for assembly of F1-ATPase
VKRFYKEVTVEPEDGGWRVKLDGRGIKTPSGKPQVVPTQALAQDMAQEWSGQGEEIDAAAFVLRDLADYAIDAVAADRVALVSELAAYAETDTLCYRGDVGEALFERQAEVWDPLLSASEERWNVRFDRISGIIHHPQPAGTLARMEQLVAAESDFGLAALRMLTSLSASLVVALTAIEPDADPDTLWTAANLEQDWQADLWGLDAEAQKVRQIRFDAFKLAMRFAVLARTN